MGLWIALLAALLSLASACVSDEVTLDRGGIGPAAYRVRLEVSGEPTVRDEAVDAGLSIRSRPRGAVLRLRVEGDDPLVAELERLASGRLRLQTVQGVSPGSAGEADLASLVGQLDPPLPDEGVRIGERWTRSRRIVTDTLRADLRSTLRLTGFRRVAGADAAVIEGVLNGRLRAEGPSGVFAGGVSGTTRFSWLVADGRLGASSTSLRWSLPGSGDVTLRTEIAPAQG